MFPNRVTPLLLLAMCMLSCKSTPPPRAIPFRDPAAAPKVSSATQDYRVAIGDSIDVFVIEDPSMDQEFVVRGSGDIILPKIGRVSVVGKTLGEVEKTVAERLEIDTLKKATVIVDPVRRGGSAGDGRVIAGLTIFLNGALNKTGRVQVPFVGDSQVTAYQAVADCGGFAAFANKKKSAILRKSGMGRAIRIPINFESIETGVADDPVLRDGDVIVVPLKVFGF